MISRRLLFCCALICGSAFAQSAEDTIRGVLTTQAAAWNRGDLESFTSYYGSDALFVGTEITRGRAGVLARYRERYGSAEKRGQLEFSDLEVHMLGPDHASVIGRFHLTRTAAGGGDAKGIFTLVMTRDTGSWKISVDHTS